MDYQRLAGDLNRKVSALYPSWGSLAIWDDRDEPSIVHMAYSAVLAVIQDADVEWVAVDVDGTEDRDSTTFTLTFWTNELVVQVVRSPGELHPVVAIAKRANLQSLELLTAPLLTKTHWGYVDESVAVRLSYPTFNATLRDPRGSDLLAALPSLVAEL